MEREQQLRWEREKAPLAASAAALSAILTIAGAVYLQSKIKTSPADSVESILLVHGHKSDLLISAVLQAIGTALLAPALYYLFRATSFRRPQLPAAIKYLVVLAPILGGVTTVIRQVQIAHASDSIVASLPLPPAAAKTLVSDKVGETPLVVVGGIATAAALGIAFMFLLLSLNAMRAGLLSKFIGTLGIIVGVLGVLPIFPVPIVQTFWLGAVAVLFLNRWPQGRGPAWDSGEAIPWPTAQDRRDALNPDAAPQRPLFGRPRATAPAGPDEDAEADRTEVQHTREAARPRQSATHPRSKKRKRKRRG
ncbi:MAG: hypothetical protein QOF55_302 [Thermoleophilaceae bacterium]|nr:hypothetical protein [Thermoleophilaceae bacterium]